MGHPYNATPNTTGKQKNNENNNVVELNITF